MCPPPPTRRARRRWCACARRSMPENGAPGRAFACTATPSSAAVDAQRRDHRDGRRRHSVTVVIAVGRGRPVRSHAPPRRHSATRGRAAARGEILDQAATSGGYRRAIDVLVDRRRAPQRCGRSSSDVLDRLAGILGISTRPGRCRPGHPATFRLAPVQCDVQGRPVRGQTSVVVATDVSAPIARALTRESAALPGVSTNTTSQRTYPRGNLAAQAIGTIGDISAVELNKRSHRGLSRTSVIGRSGLEARVRPDLHAGDTLHTSLDAQLQADRTTGAAARHHRQRRHRRSVRGDEP